MRIVCTYHGTQRNWQTSETEFVFGRAEEKFRIDLDLSSDQKVSRLHGRIWEENGLHWIEDLNSSHGTLLNGVEIKGRGKQPLKANDIVLVGETTLRIDSLNASSDSAQTTYLEQGTTLLSNSHRSTSGVAIAQDVDATGIEPIPIAGASEEAARRLKVICDLPLQFAAKTKLESLLPTIVDRLGDVIPKGESWALMLLEPGTDALLLKAYNYVRQPYLSETLARRAMRDCRAFIWKRNLESDISGSIAQNAIEAGMYAPLLWQDEALGVICAGAQSVNAAFTEDDLRLMVVVAQYAAMAVASQRLQEELRKESMIKANLLRQFSPKVAERLLTHRGRLRLGGERSEVTILNSDIRGFTESAQEMDPDDVVEMLNDYFAVLVPVIFAHGGTIDKYMGDAILAIFGSPEPDPRQHEHAVRAAIEMQSAVAKLNEVRRLRGVPHQEFGIGIHSGEVVHGFVGTPERMEFTIISDAVNRTARYCAAAAGGEVLISPEVHERVWRMIEAEQTTIGTKHEGDFVAYRVSRFKPNFQESSKGMDSSH